MTDIATYDFGSLALDAEPNQSTSPEPLISLSTSDETPSPSPTHPPSPNLTATSSAATSPQPMLPPSISPEQLKHLTFHAKYGIRFEGDDVILRSSTKTCFYASLATLVKYSNFFANMISLPDTHSHSTIIDLPSATSDAIVCLISMISPHHTSDWITDLASNSDKEGLCRTLSGIFAFIDAYDAVGLLSLLVPHFDHKDELHFLIACVGGVEASAVTLSTDLVKLGPLDKHITRLLTHHAPEYARRWETLLTNRSHSWEQCQRLILSGQPIEGCGNNFGKKCRVGKGCAGMTAGEQSMKRLRYQAGITAIEAIKNSDGQSQAINACRKAMEFLVHCPNCSTRLWATFRHAIRNSGYLSDVSI